MKIEKACKLAIESEMNKNTVAGQFLRDTDTNKVDTSKLVKKLRRL